MLRGRRQDFEININRPLYCLGDEPHQWFILALISQAQYTVLFLSIILKNDDEWETSLQKKHIHGQASCPTIAIEKRVDMH